MSPTGLSSAITRSAFKTECCLASEASLWVLASMGSSHCDARCNSAVCAPRRASGLTGRDGRR